MSLTEATTSETTGVTPPAFAVAITSWAFPREYAPIIAPSFADVAIIHACKSPRTSFLSGKTWSGFP